MWFTIEELSLYLKVSKETLYKLAKSRRLPSSKIGNQWRFKKEIIDEWLAGQSDTSLSITPTDNKPDLAEIK